MKIPGAGKSRTCIYSRGRNETKELVHNFDRTGYCARECIISTVRSKVLQEAVFLMHLIQSRIFGLPQKIRFQKSMIIHLKDIFRRFMTLSLMRSSKKQALSIFYTLIDDAVARVMKSEGGYIWACKKLRRRCDE